MAGLAPLPPVAQINESVLLDAGGQPALVLAQNHVTVIQPDGSMTEHRRDTSIALVDGLLWRPGMMNGEVPIMLGICEFCRHPPRGLFACKPTHGLCTQQNGMLCASCGSFTCPRHRQEGSDGRWRCRPCAKKQKRHSWFERVLFQMK